MIQITNRLPDRSRRGSFVLVFSGLLTFGGVGCGVRSDPQADRLALRRYLEAPAIATDGDGEAPVLGSLGTDRGVTDAWLLGLAPTATPVARGRALAALERTLVARPEVFVAVKDDLFGRRDLDVRETLVRSLVRIPAGSVSPTLVEALLERIQQHVEFMDASAGSSSTDEATPRARENARLRAMRRTLVEGLVAREDRRASLRLLESVRARHREDVTLVAVIVRALAAVREDLDGALASSGELAQVLEAGRSHDVDEIRRLTYGLMGWARDHGGARYEAVLRGALETERFPDIQRSIRAALE